MSTGVIDRDRWNPEHCIGSANMRRRMPYGSRKGGERGIWTDYSAGLARARTRA
jgi:hypothetical protein